MKQRIVDPERLSELCDVLSKIDPKKKHSWVLELIGDDGMPKTQIDIRTGRTISGRKPKGESNDVLDKG